MDGYEWKKKRQQRASHTHTRNSVVWAVALDPNIVIYKCSACHDGGRPPWFHHSQPPNPGLALVAGVTERKCKRGPHTSPTTKPQKDDRRGRERTREKNSSRRVPPISTTHTWLLLVGVLLLLPRDIPVARARACVCVVVLRPAESDV
jgi:hypothetical protein